MKESLIRSALAATAGALLFPGSAQAHGLHGGPLASTLHGVVHGVEIVALVLATGWVLRRWLSREKGKT